MSLILWYIILEVFLDTIIAIFLEVVDETSGFLIKSPQESAVIEIH